MPLPDLATGLVIRYEYLWHSQAKSGADTAEKERPACVALVFESPERGKSVLLLPITHSEPNADQSAVEIPLKVKKLLGLDDARSWVLVSECNIDIWPTPDIRPLPGQTQHFAYGHLPPKLFRKIRDAFMTAYRERTVKTVTR
ncbi:MAG: hypothetical protein HQL45_07515 [Alphaproteobacteria bacterium]|nr:hypothetical protein [Alphaproteobacteria bacterium]